MRRFVFLLTLLVCVTPALAQRELHWNALSVKARLDAEGVLHVDEQQVMVFTGDWNGGERRFNIRPRQELTLKGIGRLDENGQEIALQQGSLSAVDHYDWTERNLLRWRSRDPSSASFDKTALTYVLHYSITNVLQRDGEHYVLAHDFAFGEREGWIYNVAVELTLDPVWQPAGTFEGTWSQKSLAPGQGFDVRVPLRYTGTNAPVVDAGPSTPVKGMVAALLLAPPMLFIVAMLREKMLGRLERLRPDQVTRAWLQQNVLGTDAEVIGALWDEDVGAAEVSALLARMVAEEKIDSRVELGDMKLTLKVPRESLHGYERDLVDGLFVSGDHTSTAAVRNHYKSSGFDPSKLIADGVKAKAEKRLPPDEGKNVWRFIPTLLWLASTATLGYVALNHQPLRMPAVFLFFGSLFGCVFAIIGPNHWRTRKHLGVGSALLQMIPATIIVSVAAYVVLRSANLGSPDWPMEMQLAVTLVALWIFATAIHGLSSRESRARIAMRKLLTSAREYFRRELEKPNPAMDDAWFPYVLAFGLDDEVGRWSRQFATAASTASHTSSSFGSSSSSYSSSSSSSSWTGGGGGFGGAGATGAWGAAAAGMAAGVASPSSSGSSGGSSGGGSSSGGGGGGGW